MLIQLDAKEFVNTPRSTTIDQDTVTKQDGEFRAKNLDFHSNIEISQEDQLSDQVIFEELNTVHQQLQQFQEKPLTESITHSQAENFDKSKKPFIQNDFSQVGWEERLQWTMDRVNEESLRRDEEMVNVLRYILFDWGLLGQCYALCLCKKVIGFNSPPLLLFFHQKIFLKNGLTSKSGLRFFWIEASKWP